MAELFFQQGHPSRALAIYRHVVREHPDDTKSKQRLQEIEAYITKHQGSPMSFREHTQRIVESTKGALACAIMGFDGIAIDSYEVGGGEIDIPNLLVEYATAAQQLRRTAIEQQTPGALTELAVSGSKLSTLLRPLNEEYFLAVVLGPNAFAGKARYLMRVIAPLLMEELS